MKIGINLKFKLKGCIMKKFIDKWETICYKEICEPNIFPVKTVMIIGLITIVAATFSFMFYYAFNEFKNLSNYYDIFIK